MSLVTSCSSLCPIHWSPITGRERSVVRVAPTGGAPNTSEWSTMSLSTKLLLLLEVWRYMKYIDIYFRKLSFASMNSPCRFKSVDSISLQMYFTSTLAFAFHSPGWKTPLGDKVKVLYQQYPQKKIIMCMIWGDTFNYFTFPTIYIATILLYMAVFVCLCMKWIPVPKSVVSNSLNITPKCKQRII